MNRNDKYFRLVNNNQKVKMNDDLMKKLKAEEQLLIEKLQQTINSKQEYIKKFNVAGI